MDKLIPSTIAMLLIALFLFVRFWLRPFLKEAIENYMEESKKRKHDDDNYFTEMLMEDELKNTIHRKTIF